MELPTPVDSTFHQFTSGFVLEVVSEVDEMGLFHQLGYENRERGLQQSTASSDMSLARAPQGAGLDPPTDEKASRELSFRMALAFTQTVVRVHCGGPQCTISRTANFVLVFSLV